MLKRGLQLTDTLEDTSSNTKEAPIEESSQETVGLDSSNDSNNLDPILHYINSQDHKEKDLNSLLNAYSSMISYSTNVPKRFISSINTHSYATSKK